MAAKKKAAKAAKKAPAKKAAPKKAAPKKAAAKKSPAKKVVAAKPAAPVKLGAQNEPMAKTAMVQHIANNTGLSRKQVSSVVEELAAVIGAHVNKKAGGQFVMPGLFKITVVRKPAQKGGKKVMMMGKEVVTKPKPARNIVKVRALKKLKDMAA